MSCGVSDVLVGGVIGGSVGVVIGGIGGKIGGLGSVEAGFTTKLTINDTSMSFPLETVMVAVYVPAARPVFGVTVKPAVPPMSMLGMIVLRLKAKMLATVTWVEKLSASVPLNITSRSPVG